MSACAPRTRSNLPGRFAWMLVPFNRCKLVTPIDTFQHHGYFNMKTAPVEKRRSPETVSVKLDATERGRIAALAASKKRTPHYLMKEAILEYVGREEARQKFTAAAVESFEHYKETGLHVTLDEFNHWVDAVQSHADTPVPVCHR